MQLSKQDDTCKQAFSSHIDPFLFSFAISLGRTSCKDCIFSQKVLTTKTKSVTIIMKLAAANFIQNHFG